jgi:hypothetical protein
MATLTVQTLSSTAGLPSVAGSYAAVAGGGDVFPNNGKTFCYFKNTNASTRVVTFTIQATAAGGHPITSPTITVPVTTGESIFGPFDQTLFNNSSGQVAMTYSASTNLSVLVVSFP